MDPKPFVQKAEKVSASPVLAHGEAQLRSELAKPEPDAKKAAGIQKEISNLESELDQKRLDHRIKMKKDFPDFGAGGYGYGPRGKGMGRGMYGGGGYGPGSCWN